MTSGSARDYTDQRVKHLGMIQGVISRLAGNCAAMKRFSLVLVALGVGAHRAVGEPDALLAFAGMVVVFWLQDARYLQQEIWYRHLRSVAVMDGNLLV